MIEESKALIKLVNTLARITQSYTDEAMKKYNLSSGTYPFMVALIRKEGVSQNHISKELNIDKAASARAIKKLIELKYIRKELDEEDSRAYKLYLTEKGRSLIPEIHKELSGWINIISANVENIEQEQLTNTLEKLLENAKEYKLQTKEE